MPRGAATAAIASHLWQHHGRHRSSGTLIERTLIHEELHAIADEGELSHSHGPNGDFVVRCPCGHEHTCTVLSDPGE